MSVAILAQYPNNSCLRMPLVPRPPRSQAQLFRCYAKCQLAALTIEEKESMRQAVNADIEIGSWYSGWDPDFLAIEAVRKALGAECIDFIHSSEICSDRSQFILAHPRKCQPKHLFGDFTMRMPSNILEAAAVLQVDAQRIASQRVAAGEQPACIKEEVEKSLYTSLHNLFHNVAIAPEQECLKCRNRCPVWEVQRNSVKGMTAGTCCYDHSKLNIRRSSCANVVGQSVIPWACFAHEMRTYKPDFIIEECTPLTEQMVRFMLMFLGEGWTAHSWWLKPNEFGDPQTGKRRWTIYLNHHGNTRWATQIESPVSRFGCTPKLDLNSFWSTPKDVVNQCLQKLRVKKGFRKNDKSKTWE